MNVRTRHSLIALLLAFAACWFNATSVVAQGRSIPKGSEAKAQEILLDDELPEGQTHRYPLLNGLNVSVDIFDPLYDIFTASHASYEAQVMLSLHNRFFPMAAMGMGYADETSNNGIEFSTGEKQEFTFKSEMSPFMKLGMAYNLRYNSTTPEDTYMVFARYGIAHSKADLTNIYYASSNWPDVHLPDHIGQEYTTQWIEAGMMLKVKLWWRFSLGWDLYAKIKLAQSGTEKGKPAFVPGYGDCSSLFGFNFRIFYNIF